MHCGVARPVLSEAEKRSNRSRKIARLLKEWDQAVQYAVQTSRKQAKMSQEVAAERMGWTADVLSNVEKGRRKLTVSELIVLADQLGMNPETMFRRVLSGR